MSCERLSPDTPRVTHNLLIDLYVGFSFIHLTKKAAYFHKRLFVFCFLFFCFAFLKQLKAYLLLIFQPVLALHANHRFHLFRVAISSSMQWPPSRKDSHLAN